MIPAIDKEHDLYLLFERLNLIENGKFKRAAILLFGKNPQKYIIQSYSKIGKFLSDSELLTSDIVEGNLFEQLEQIVEILKSKYLHSFISYDELQRIETLEYPFDAVREAVINALIHRDYTDPTVLQIRVYENKLVFTNGATLSQEVPIEQFKELHISKPFNPLIANIFYKAGFVESWGKGTNSIVAECLKLNLPEPEYRYTFHSVQVILYKKLEKASEGISEGINTLYQYISDNLNQRVSQIEKSLNIPTKTLERWIKKLKDMDKIEYKGSKKTGGYVVKNKPAL